MSGTITHKTDSLHVHVFGLRPVCAINFSRDQSSAKLINFLDSRLDTRDSRLDPRDSRLDTRNYRGSSIESRGSRIEARGTVNLLLSGTVSVEGSTKYTGSVLHSWARHFTLRVPLSTQVYKWVMANLMPGVTLQWTIIPSRRGRNTPSCFILQKQG